MGFVGGGGNIAIVTALPLIIFVLIAFNYLLLYGLWNSSYFYARLEFRYPDVNTNPGPRRPIPSAFSILCSNVRGLSRNLKDLTVASSQYDL